jgi:hypothetical protein
MPKKQNKDEYKEELVNLEKVYQLSSTPGGKYLAEVTKTAVFTTINTLIHNYKDMSRDELVSLCAKLSEQIGILELFTGTEDKIKAIEELYKENKEE